MSRSENLYSDKSFLFELIRDAIYCYQTYGFVAIDSSGTLLDIEEFNKLLKKDNENE